MLEDITYDAGYYDNTQTVMDMFRLVMVLCCVLYFAADICVSCMETNGNCDWLEGLRLTVPLRIAAKVGKNWATLCDY